MLLQGPHVDLITEQRFDPLHGSPEALHRRDARNASGDCG